MGKHLLGDIRPKHSRRNTSTQSCRRPETYANGTASFLSSTVSAVQICANNKHDYTRLNTFFESIVVNNIIAEIVAKCKRFDKAMKQQRVNSVIGKADTVTEKVGMCSYPKCGKRGNTAAQCWLRKKEKEKAKAEASKT